MSAAYPLLSTLQNQDVLGELLHSLSQPLTTLRCSLELSLDEATEQEQAAVGIALQQTEKVIGMIQLMREYLDAEQPGVETHRVALGPVLRSVIEDSASIAELRGVELRLDGACSATVALAESRLRLALQYLIWALVEGVSAGTRVQLNLEEGSTESALRASVHGSPLHAEAIFDGPPRKPDSISVTLRTVKLAIARRVLETAGTLLTFEDGERPGFILRIPRMLAASRAVV